MAGYTRQSVADIINGSDITAPPINAEFNQIQSAFNGTTGHSHDGSTGNAPKIDLTTSLSGYLPADHGGVGGKNKLDATAAPTATDDASDGYAPGSLWENTTDGRVYICVGNTNSAAVWRELVTVITNNKIEPVTTDSIDLGTPTVRFQDLYLSGGISASGNVAFGGTLTQTGASTFTGLVTANGGLTVDGNSTLTGNVTLGDSEATDDTITVYGKFASDLLPETTQSLGSTALQWNNLYLDGTATIDTLTVDENATIAGTLGVTGASTLGNVTVGNITATENSTHTFANSTISNLGTVTTAAIGGGTINNTVIGGSNAAAITGTTITASTGFSGDLTGDVTGDLTGSVSGNVTASAPDPNDPNDTSVSTFYDVTINNGLDMTSGTIDNVATPTENAHAANKGYVDTQITNLIGGAPDALDTLNELAAAINDDENVYTTLTTSIGTKLPKAGGTMTGAIAMGDNKITGLATPTADADAATKKYVDDQTTLAQTYASNASTSATNAAASYDSFDDRYLGAKASDPTVDNDGDALLTGALYYDSTNSVMKVYSGSEWNNASSSISGIKSNFYYTATSGQTAFSGTDDNSNSLVIDKSELVNVYMNGVRLHEDDYTISVGTNTVTLATGASTGDLIYLEVFGNFAGQSGADVSITGGTVAGVELNNSSVESGNLTISDYQTLFFGDDNDGRMYHNGFNVFLDSYNSKLNLRNMATDGDVVIAADDGSGGVADYITADGSTGQVKLRYYGDLKLNTSSTGINVDGTVSSDSLIVINGGSDTTATFGLGGQTSLRLSSDSGNNSLLIRDSENEARIKTEDSRPLRLGANDSDIMHISNFNRVGIMNSTPSTALDVTGTVTADRYDTDEALPTVRPTLNLDFANSKTLNRLIEFERGSTATYWDGHTTVKAEENLIRQADNINYNRGTASGSQTGPTGATETYCYLYTPNTTSGNSKDIYFYDANSYVPANTTFTYSVFVKANGINFVSISAAQGGNDFIYAVANLSTGSITETGWGGTGNYDSSSISDVGNGWYRLSVTGDLGSNTVRFAFVAGSSSATPNITTDYGRSSMAGDGTSGFYVYGYQIELRDGVTAYTPTTTRAITKYQPQLQTAANNVARFNHDPVTGESKGLLLEESRTNLMPYSKYDSTNWNANDYATTYENYGIAPDGTQTATFLRVDADGTTHSYASDNITGSYSTTYTGTCFVKSDDYDYAFIEFGNTAFNSRATVIVRLSDGVVVAEDGSAESSATGYSEAIGNGWYRIGITATSDASGGAALQVAVGFTENSTTNSGGSPHSTGDGHSGGLFWGLQLETGSFPTSYIPTSGSTATRSKDACSIEDISSFYNDVESTVFITTTDANHDTNSRLWAFDDDSTSAFYAYQTSTDTSSRFAISIQGTNEAASSPSVTSWADDNSFAVALKTDDVRNQGPSVAYQDNNAVLPDVTRLQIGGLDNGFPFNGHIKKFTYFPKRLSDATLEAMVET